MPEVVADGGGWLVRRDGRDQSWVDLEDPRRLAFDYVRRIADLIDVRAPAGEPVRVVHVGGAGLALPRYVAHTRPGSAQVVLEPDEELTALVRRELPLPARSGIKVRPVAGRPGLAELRSGYADVVVVDAFDEGRLPAELVSSTWFAEVARVLVDDGVLCLNLSDRAPWTHSRRVLAGVAAHLPEVVVSAEPATLKARRPGNLVLLASRALVPETALRDRARAGPLPSRVLGPRQVSDTLGGGVPFGDADALAGPDHLTSRGGRA